MFINLLFLQGEQDFSQRNFLDFYRYHIQISNYRVLSIGWHSLFRFSWVAAALKIREQNLKNGLK
jgi:hypothetical protein